MANCFASVNVVRLGGEGGGSAVGLSSYVDRANYINEVTGQRYHFSQEAGDVAHSEVMLPEGAPEEMLSARELWNAAERAELVKDGSRFKVGAQVAKHVILALPKELTDAERVELAQRFVQERWVSHGVAAQLTIHHPEEGSVNHHAHVIISTRHLEAQGFTTKARELNPGFAAGRLTEKDRLNDVWTAAQNAYFAERGYDLRVDPKAPVAGVHMGAARFVEGSAREAANEEARQETIALIRAEPERVLDQMTEQSSTFTLQDVARALNRWTETEEQFKAAFAKVQAHPDLVQLTKDGTEAGRKVHARYTTRRMATVEAKMVATARDLAGNQRHGVAPDKRADAIKGFEARAGYALSDEQRAAVRHITAEGDLKAVVGLAGTGKSTMLEAANDAWKAEGYKVYGAALSGIATDNVAQSGIESRTLHAWQNSFERADALASFIGTSEMSERVERQLNGYLTWAEKSAKTEASRNQARSIRSQLESGNWTAEGRAWVTDWARRQLDKTPKLDSNSVLVIDEAGMVGSRQLERFVSRAQAEGAKVVLVGDPKQLQPIEAGAAFRAIAQRVGYAELNQIRRQRTEWMRDATKDLSEMKAGKAIAAYDRRGHIRAGVALDERATVARVEEAFGPMSADDRARVLHIAQYAEARNAAGALWSCMSGDRQAADVLADDFREWQGKRNAAASAIASDLDGHKPWLEKLGINGESLAADMLAAAGTKRAEAVEKAPEHARALGIEQYGTEPAEIRPDYRTGAKAALVKDWAADREASPDKTPIMLAHTRKDVADLNRTARDIARSRGELTGHDVTVETQDGARSFAVGDRVVFLENNGRMGVRNGTLGRVEKIEQADQADQADQATTLAVRTDRGDLVAVKPADYAAFDHGYAVTVHKAQGVTVDRAYVLASSQVDGHLGYVALSRHREDVRVYAAAGDAINAEVMGRIMMQTRSQDTTLDYAGNRGIGPDEVPPPQRQKEAPEQQRQAKPERERDQAGKEPARAVTVEEFKALAEEYRKHRPRAAIDPEARTQVDTLLPQIDKAAAQIKADPARMAEAERAGFGQAVRVGADREAQRQIERQAEAQRQREAAAERQRQAEARKQEAQAKRQARAKRRHLRELDKPRHQARPIQRQHVQPEPSAPIREPERPLHYGYRHSMAEEALREGNAPFTAQQLRREHERARTHQEAQADPANRIKAYRAMDVELKFQQVEGGAPETIDSLKKQMAQTAKEIQADPALRRDAEANGMARDVQRDALRAKRSEHQQTKADPVKEFSEAREVMRKASSSMAVDKTARQQYLDARVKLEAAAQAIQRDPQQLARAQQAGIGKQVQETLRRQAQVQTQAQRQRQHQLTPG